jgi:hypothetical protein
MHSFCATDSSVKQAQLLCEKKTSQYAYQGQKMKRKKDEKSHSRDKEARKEKKKKISS